MYITSFNIIIPCNIHLNNLHFEKSLYFPMILSVDKMFICKSLIPMVIKLDILKISLWFRPDDYHMIYEIR